MSAPPCVYGPPAEAVAARPEPGRPEWFETEIVVHERSVRAYLRMKFPQLTDLDDLIQETYLRILRADARHPIQPSRALFFTVARNLALDLCRRRTVVSMRSLEEGAAPFVYTAEPDAAEHASSDNDHALVSSAIAALPERMREVVELRKLRGLSHREIAARLGISERTSMAHMNAALAKVRQYLLEHGLSRQP